MVNLGGSTNRWIVRRFSGLALCGLVVLQACSDGQALVVPAAPDEIVVPPGFELSIAAEGLDGVRTLKMGPDGKLYAVQSRAGSVVRMELTGGSAANVEVVLEGLRQPFGLAFHQGQMYVGETHQIIRVPLEAGGPSEVIVGGLPTGGHWTREIGIGPDEKLYLSVGSSCNVCEESDPRLAAITRYELDGSNETIFATGLRNSVGLAWHPDTGQLWASVNERDNLGDDVPPDAINLIVEGGDYGWPYCNSNRIPNPEFDDEARCAPTLPPALEIQAHSAPLGMVFYTGTAFPVEYQGDLFLALHGSWNRSEPTGYKLVRVNVEDGAPVSYEDFAYGWLEGEVVKGRPVYPVLGPDGALYLSDDSNGRIYRIGYGG